MKMSLNAVPVLLALVLVLEYISAETSAASSTPSAISSATSAPSSTTSTASTTTGPTNPTSAASTTSTTSEAPSARSATEKWEELEGCFEKRQCDNVTCEECSPEDGYCAGMCRLKCRCSCGGYKISTDPDLWILGLRLRSEHDCRGQPTLDQCSRSCSEDQECQHECELKYLQCLCARLQSAARSKDSVAITTTTATSCSLAYVIINEWRDCLADCFVECDAGSDEEPECRVRGKRKRHNCACACAGLPSATDYDHLDESDECLKEVERNGETCIRTTFGPQIDPERSDWCRVFEHRRQCACLAAGAAGSSGAAEYRMGTKDKEQLLRCAEAWRVSTNIMGPYGLQR
ncbi:uncharacterized protein LOC113214625 [Frankliniella occidentalis]|uniref:Uncharacterized protein LOC113214625 n=1 Tax=Frankliniella occidentalis TaxID=133901 RepID=A0A9C6U2N4_FRAOC|nr:uncharacterized protein LOC113214625 [Frankliniella occidentalis]